MAKDLFDAVDIRRDGLIDLHEWQQTFGRVTEGAAKMSLKATPLTMWENSRDFEQIGFLMAKNRKQLAAQFKAALPGSLFSFEQGRQALDGWLHTNFGARVTDEQLKCVFRVAQMPAESQLGPRFCYLRLLEVYR